MITKNEYRAMSRTKIDSMIWDIQRELMNRYGVTASERMVMPLVWYIDTGRASCNFLRALASVCPFLIARDLAKGGSDEEIINRICRRIKYDRFSA